MSLTSCLKAIEITPDAQLKYSIAQIGNKLQALDESNILFYNKFINESIGWRSREDLIFIAIETINGDRYGDFVSSGKVFLAYFWAEWEERSLSLAPVLAEVAAAFDGEALFGGVNVDDDGFLAMELNIYTLPLVLLYENGAEVDRVAGVQPPEVYHALVEERVRPVPVNPYDLINSMGYGLH
jgi:thiol-disulfide isomerase/thioredoxin